jgi:DNA mismatch endonuclease (patch repair protein)
MGYRYRLHAKTLPGTPDIVFPGRVKAIFVHGCFWHQHPSCRGAYIPNSRIEYWLPKLQRNKERDAENLSELGALGWKVLTIWECQLADQSKLQKRLQRFLGA